MGARCSGLAWKEARLDDHTILVTGSNTGIGLCTVEHFVSRGARVLMACRDLEKAEAAAAGVRDRTAKAAEAAKAAKAAKTSGAAGAAEAPGPGSVRVIALDLSSLSSVRACARLVLETEPHLHILVNNAGVMCCPEGRTAEGFEMQLGVNHLGHFLLTCLLLPRLRASAPARVVTVSSIAHRPGQIDFDDLNWKENYNPTMAYARSKLANILFTKELAKRGQGSGVTAYSLHPGVVATEVSRHFDTAYFKGVTWFFNNVARFMIKNPEEGAETTIYCSVAAECANENGLYYRDCHKADPHPRAEDPVVAARLWEESAKLVGLGTWDPFTAKETPGHLLE